ncbi:MAG TPA: gluconeogenesis factor YvcK family protein [Candidatus Paceibacterota bacterium]|nr:gluconeogenesis factor YvcK family protein [Candidatus Paceibacterota bacterium]
MANLRIVTLGGGGGQAQILRALREIEGLEITGICPSTDSGGSTGILKDEYEADGYLGDLTKCAAALCRDELLSRALMYRYQGGSLRGHSVKNLLLLALEKEGGKKGGLEAFWKLCGLNGHRVLPVTMKKTQLCAALRTGGHIASETVIDTIAKNPLWHPDTHAISRVYLKPEPRITPEVEGALSAADWIIISPGDFYSSIIPVLLPKGMKEAISRSPGKIVLLLNLVNKRGETDNYTADDFLKRIEKHLGRRTDVVFCNSKEIPRKVALNYRLEDKVVFPSRKIDRAGVLHAPFASVSPEGVLLHDLAVLRREFKKLLFSDPL